MTDYAARLNLPLTNQLNDFTIQFKTSTGLVVANGYTRVVIGGRGPYIEFYDWMMVKDAIYVPQQEQWRVVDPKASMWHYYEEYRSRDKAYVKCYHQLRTVDYADYRPGMWYISPFELTTDQYPVLVNPLEKKSKEPPLEPDMFDGL